MRPVRSSLHDEVAERLRQLIFAGELAPGSFIDEPALCASLAISRTPLREALKVLAAEGLVRHEPRRGSFVNQVTAQDLDQIFPVLALLEGRAAFEAAQQASDAELQALQALHERLQRHARARRIADYYAANLAIHEAIIALADNPWLARVIGDLRKLAKLARLQQLQAPGRLEQSCAEHLALFAALQARDAPAAQAAMHEHLLRQREALREVARSQANRIAP
ncbi:GntR family transcriptional regulator [Pseudorhodoferax aquiterrae]|uniref:GntR family transcriptional regulator n=1 Tax=Pseudorhodoferax aquiterrae TaxID=747304 RepID=A0ABQ3G6N2_9BURK|nr:GntR family transcriptional regulator [Pseudorhodoferax aquiterrae]GHC91303.1 GntR family transcriptional regulator [Pseudorhodoferax aquiterrae]